MKRFLLLPALAVGLLTGAPLWAQSSASVDLSGNWKFSKGDNAAWAAPAFDDAGWKDIKVPGAWQTQGHPDVTGYAWYRKRVSLPASWGNDPIVKEGKVLRLDLGAISDVYEVFWNGALIAQGGKMPAGTAPHEPSAGPVRTGVPADRTTFGGGNLLAVRVYDNEAPSGILSGPLALRQPSFRDFITVAVKSEKDRREFTGAEGLPFDIVVGNEGPIAWEKGTVTVTLRDGAGKPVVTRPLSMDVASGRQLTTGMHLKQEELNPGIYTVSAIAQMGDEALSLASRTFVYNPAGIRGGAFSDPATAQAFLDRADTFWKSTLTALKNTPIGGYSTLAADKSTDKVKVYKVSYNALRGQPIHGWLAVPAGATDAARAPGVVVLPGYGNSAVEPPMALAENGFAALAINIHGAEVDAKSYPSAVETYSKGGVDDPNTIVLRGMVAAGLRAVDFLAQRPEVNADRIAVIGASQGGGLAVDVAALDPRVKTVVANSPAADFRRMLATSKDNPIGGLVNGLSADVKAQLLDVMGYFDPVILANRVRVPVLLTIGMRDTVTPPETAYALKNAFPDGLVVSIIADETSGHNVTPDQATASLNWLKKFLVG